MRGYAASAVLQSFFRNFFDHFSSLGNFQPVEKTLTQDVGGVTVFYHVSGGLKSLQGNFCQIMTFVQGFLFLGRVACEPGAR